MTYQDVCDKIGTLNTQAEAIVVKNAAVEHWPAEDQTTFDRIHGEMRGFREQKRRLDLQREVATELEAPAPRATEANELRSAPASRGESRSLAEDADGALRAWMLAQHGPQAFHRIRPEWRSAAAKLGVELLSGEFPYRLVAEGPRSTRAADLDGWDRRYLGGFETRALTVTGAAGGYLISPEMNRALEEARLYFGPMLQVSTTIRTDSGAPLPFPSSNGTAQKGRILAINTQVTQTDPAFSQMNLGAFKYSSDMVLVPEELIQDSGVPISSLLGKLLGERIARILNQHFTVGVGTTEPAGIVPMATAVNLGTGTAAGFGSTTDGTAVKNILKIMHGVDKAYRTGGPKVGWMMNDAIVQYLAGITDGQGRPLWMPSLVGGEPDRLLGYPIFINNDMTATFANLARTVLFGDFSNYYVREVRDVAILSSRERFIDFHQVAFLAFGRYDGNLLNAGTGPVKAGVHQT